MWSAESTGKSFLGTCAARCYHTAMAHQVAMAAVLVVLTSICAPTTAHIHSHKVAYIDRDRVSLEIWVLALLSSVLVAAAGVLPLLLNRYVHLDEKRKDGLPLRAVLSFAVGGLLGDVFLHLLPEAWGPATGAAGDWKTGGWVLVGLVSFLLVEKVANCTESDNGDSQPPSQQSRGVSNGVKSDALIHCNGHVAPASSQTDVGSSSEAVPAISTASEECTTAGMARVDVRGYLNLIANCTDNFTHGLAIAASYVASPAVGILTTIAILCHEIPHEIGDFAILLSSGFDTWSAAKFQALTATGGLVGVVAGLTAENFSSTSSWLLPFTAGGFLYIALVSILPQMMEDSDPTCSLLQVATLLLGIVVMAMVSVVEKQSCKHLPSEVAS